MVEEMAGAPMNTPVEPTALQRQVALELRQSYVALREQGFTEMETLFLLGEIIANTKRP